MADEAARYIASQAILITLEIVSGEREDRTGDTVARYINHYSPKLGTTVDEVMRILKEISG